MTRNVYSQNCLSIFKSCTFFPFPRKYLSNVSASPKTHSCGTSTDDEQEININPEGSTRTEIFQFTRNLKFRLMHIINQYSTGKPSLVVMVIAISVIVEIK